MTENPDTSQITNLIGQLTDDSYTVRTAAHKALVQAGKMAIPALILALRGSNSSLRGAVGNCLSEIGEASIPALLQILNDADGHVQFWGAVTIGSFKNSQTVEPLLEGLEQAQSSAARRGFISALGEIGDLRAVTPIIRFLEDTDSSVRVGAAEALGNLGDPQAGKALVIGLEDVDNIVRMYCALALGKLGDLTAVAPLLARFKKEQDSQVRWEIVIELGKLGDPQAYDTLLATLQNDQDGVIRCFAALALGRLGDSRAIQPLIKTVRDKDYNVRYRCIEALGVLGAEQALPLLRTIRDKEKWGYVDREEVFYPASEAAAKAIEQIEQRFQSK